MTRLPVDTLVDSLVERGDVWTTAPGFVGLRGQTALLFTAIERLACDVATSLASDVWRSPATLSFQTLARADYFASFPQWLTSIAHLSDDRADLTRVASHAMPARVARDHLTPLPTALPPAVCYHTYAALADTCLTDTVLMTAQGTCWRREENFRPLERGWAFTMREAVCVGTSQAVGAFRDSASRALRELAARLELEAGLHPASDPFFAPNADSQARGRGLLQRIRELKHELQVELGNRRALAIGSVNYHDAFFGEAFDIRLRDGAPAHSACLAFGLERWVLAVLLQHGSEPGAWPAPIRDLLPACDPSTRTRYNGGG